jgi:prephenate dehydrogenase
VRLAIVGFGLIGGSIALALAEREPGAWSLTAWSRSGEGPRRALRRGVIAAAAPDPETAIRDAELVLLAAPPLANLELVDQLGPTLASREVLLSDVSSVQGPIADHAAAVPGLRFVGGHPMSGRERRGFAAATPALFLDRPWAILPPEGARHEDVSTVERLARACGGRPLRLSAAEHDAAVAGISHLPLLASVALADSVTSGAAWQLGRSLAAQGWRDMTRLARGDTQLGAGILAANAAAIGECLRAYRATLDSWQVRLDRVAEETATLDPAAAPATAELEADLGQVAARIAETPV